MRVAGGENDVDAIMAVARAEHEYRALLAAEANPTPTLAESTGLAGATELRRKNW